MARLRSPSSLHAAASARCSSARTARCPKADDRFEHLGPIADAAELARRSRRARAAAPDRPGCARAARPALDRRGRPIDGLTARRLTHRREIVGLGSRALVEQREQRRTSPRSRISFSRRSRAWWRSPSSRARRRWRARPPRRRACGRARRARRRGAASRRCALRRAGPPDFGQQRLELDPAIGARHQALQARALLGRRAQPIGGRAHEKRAIVFGGRFVERSGFDQQVRLRGGVAGLFRAPEDLFDRSSHRVAPLPGDPQQGSGQPRRVASRGASARNHSRTFGGGKAG